MRIKDRFEDETYIPPDKDLRQTIISYKRLSKEELYLLIDSLLKEWFANRIDYQLRMETKAAFAVLGM